MSIVIEHIVRKFREGGLRFLVGYSIRHALSAAKSEKFILENMYKAPRFNARSELFKCSIGGVQVDGLFLEFGVYKGKSVNYIASLVPNTVVYGFDSFEGLPEDFENGYTEGTFRLDALPIVRSNVKLVVGLFQESLEPFLNEHVEKVAFMHIDADLYSSTKYVLFKIAEHNRLQKGTVIQFDEFFYHSGWWAGGEYKAFVEFVKEFNVEFQYIGYFAPFQGAVAIEILKV